MTRFVLAGPWTIGWVAIGSRGTFSLAIATSRMAAHTRRLARSTALEVASQWRPILTPGAQPWSFQVPSTGAPDSTPVPRTIGCTITLENIGSGPAFGTHLGFLPTPGTATGGLISAREDGQRCLGNISYAGLGQRPEPPERPWWTRRWYIVREKVWWRRRDTWRMNRTGWRSLPPYASTAARTNPTLAFFAAGAGFHHSAGSGRSSG